MAKMVYLTWVGFVLGAVAHDVSADEAEMMDEVSTEPEALFTSVNTCNRYTGGTCSLFGCASSRHATCVKGRCECSLGSCNNGKGACVHEVCKKQTGGTCGLFDCDKSRNSVCVGGKCVCQGDHCSYGGICQRPAWEPPLRAVGHPVRHHTIRYTTGGLRCEHGWRVHHRDGRISVCHGTCCRHHNRQTGALTQHSFCRVTIGGRQALRQCRPRAVSELAAEDDEEADVDEPEAVESNIAPMALGFVSVAAGITMVVFVLRKKRAGVVDETPFLA